MIRLMATTPADSKKGRLITCPWHSVDLSPQLPGQTAPLALPVRQHCRRVLLRRQHADLGVGHPLVQHPTNLLSLRRVSDCLMTTGAVAIPNNNKHALILQSAGSIMEPALSDGQNVIRRYSVHPIHQTVLTGDPPRPISRPIFLKRFRLP